MPAHIILNQSKQSKIISGHPWVFPNAIEKITHQTEAGAWVEVYDHQYQIIGGGFYNPHSLYRVRMIAHKNQMQNQNNWQDIVQQKLQQAIKLRQNLNLPNIHTNAFRLCNSESDGLSGLIIDYLNDILVVSSSAYWVETHRPLLTQMIQKLYPMHRIIWLGQKKPLQQDGIENPFREDIPGLTTVIKESNIQFEIHFDQIQKTGIYIDQRENHARLAELTANKQVLDLYTYHGGFALHAACAGASHVTAVDSSAPAIEHAKRNAVLNQIEHIEWHVADARDFLSKAHHYDVIILDPPKLVPSKKHLHQAKNLYRYLHRELFKNMKSGSLLMTCNCSSALSTSDFTKLVSQQAQSVGKQLQILGTYGPAICHPILPSFPEGQYLSSLLVSVS
jgi:23S rRNA (cytosine1962-C5)-methyltransferase